MCPFGVPFVYVNAETTVQTQGTTRDCDVGPTGRLTQSESFANVRYSPDLHNFAATLLDHYPPVR